MSESLYVHFGSQTVGVLELANDNLMRFEYRPDWIRAEGTFPISLSLPFDGSYTDRASHHYFANLLPEGNVREQICRALGISPSNDFELLKAIGGECAGALEVSPRCEPSAPANPPRYEPVTDEQLAQWSVGTPDAFSDVTGHDEVRLSLAGAQDKLPVHVDDDGVILIPVAGSPSTHILKFASPFYSHLPENETFMALLAKSVGLPVVDIQLRATPKARIAVIARYDRVLRDGVYHRLHQEDFCQALGISPSNKYQKEGGPSLKQCAEVIRRHAAFPLVDLNKFLQWALFNWLAGNADAHGKNLSLLYDQSGAPSLAPFYDLVCTRNYKNLSRFLAMEMGGTADPDLVGARHLEAFAAEVKLRPKLVLGVADALLEQIANALDPVSASFVEQYGDSPIVERVPMVIRKQIRRARTLWK
ncbi:MAG: type II toxin-antitoxin system HipA family toxin [Pirellula sp.]|jgi:serine/threonine-protein kinase HipA|nr:type II toxin-antitoxin system HipA family toxin [Pirellula sp.]